MRENQIAEIEISYSAKVAKQYRLKVSNSEDAFNYFISTWSKDLLELQEEFKILLLNNDNEVLGIHSLSKGTTNSVNVDLKLMLAVTIKTCASGLIIAHNHPTGKLKPSEGDISLTKKVRKACSYLDIALLDHIIITKDKYYSFSDEDEL